MGYTDSKFKGKLNVGLTCWGLVNGVTIALFVKKFRRRVMYLTCTISLLCVYIGWTISMERFLNAKAEIAAKLTIFFIFAYSPWYNIGYNALTYSKSCLSSALSIYLRWVFDFPCGIPNLLHPPHNIT
jgi:hypothetical protein